MKTRISPESAKPAFWSRRFRRPSKPAKPAVVGIRESIKDEFKSSESTVFRIGTNQTHPKENDHLTGSGSKQTLAGVVYETSSDLNEM